MFICTACMTELMSYSFAVIFPMDLLEKGLSASNFAMLGLGDIVIPGELAVKTIRSVRQMSKTPDTLTSILLLDLKFTCMSICGSNWHETTRSFVLVTTFLSQDWIICPPAAFFGCGSRF